MSDKPSIVPSEYAVLLKALKSQLPSPEQIAKLLEDGV